MIKVELTKAEIRGGEKLKGRAIWNAEGSKTPRKILVQLRKTLEGKGMTLHEVIDGVEELDIGTRTQITVPFEFEIPLFGPLTYEGKLFTISWDVTARVDLPFAVDEVESAAVIVRPAVWTPEELQSFSDVGGDEDFDDEDLEDDEEDEESRTSRPQ